MATISIAAGHCARGREVDELFHTKSSSYFGDGNDKEVVLASNFLKGKIMSLNMCVLRPLERSMVRRNRKRMNIVAKVKKGKSHDYPWPDDIDPNLTSGHLKYLSHFKPLEDKPKPVTLAFEKPLVDLELKIIEVSNLTS